MTERRKGTLRARASASAVLAAAVRTHRTTTYDSLHQQYFSGFVLADMSEDEFVHEHTTVVAGVGAPVPGASQDAAGESSQETTDAATPDGTSSAQDDGAAEPYVCCPFPPPCMPC